jgi:protein-arginine kinase activator protein McsA
VNTLSLHDALPIYAFSDEELTCLMEEAVEYEDYEKASLYRDALKHRKKK